MAWYRCGGGSGKDRPIYKTLKLHSGKINIRDGTIESDDTYYYTDAIPFSSDITFDMGLAQTGLNYDGIALYDSSDVWVDFYAATQRYRNITYSGNATICRLSFRASNLHYIMFHDWINNIMYSTEELVRITDEEDVPLGTKTITENGTYSAQDDGVLGYSEVNVNVVVNKQISYLKWRITNTRSNPEGNAVQLSEFYLYLNDVLYNWSSNVSITASLSPVSASESIEHIIDESVDTKYTTTQWGSSSVGQCDIVISLGETITVDNNTAYAYATANDVPSRDPVGWTLFGSLDGSSWFRLDTRDGANVPTERKTSTEKFIINVGSGIDYIESWIITNNSTTMSVHTEYVDGVISSYAVYSQPGNQARVEGDLTIFIGESSGWLWNVTATADMTYRIYDIINGTLGELLTAASGTVIMSGIPITGDYTYEIRRYS